MIRCPRRLLRDTDGQALLETVIAFPVLLLFVLVVMELSMLYNAKQVANYSAFCAARAASVYGVAAVDTTHMAAAIPMSSLASANNSDADAILQAFGVTNPTMTVTTICNIDGFTGENSKWLARLANSYLRTGAPTFVVGTYGARQNVQATVTYVYRCSFLPLGVVWGQPSITAYIAMLNAFPYHGGAIPGGVTNFVTQLQNSWQWNITVHGRAATDYWVN